MVAAATVALAALARADAWAEGRGGDPALLTVERIYDPNEFTVRRFGPTRWLDNSTYTIDRTRSGRPQAATSSGSTRRRGRRPVIVPATHARPLRARASRSRSRTTTWSPDHQRLLVFTNRRACGARTRAATTGCSTSQSRPAAKARRPDRQAVHAHVRQILARRLARRVCARARSLCRVAGRWHDHAAHAATARSRSINGTFDWVYEEELELPRRIPLEPGRQAHRLLAARRDRRARFPPHQQHGLALLVRQPVQYPKAGTTNSAARIGVVSADGGPTTWLEIPGDPRNNYLARMDWAAGHERPARPAAQSPADARTRSTSRMRRRGATKPLFVDRDSAWIDVYDDRTTGARVGHDWLADSSAIRFPDGARRVAACVPRSPRRARCGSSRPASSTS